MEKFKSNNENTKKITSITEETTAEIISAIPQTENKIFDSYTTFESTKEINSFKPNEKNNFIEQIDKVKLDDMIVLHKASSVPKKHKLKQIEKRQNLCLTCNSSVQSIVPVCIWYQDKNNIHLKFNILEIDDFNINSTMKNITFK